MNIQRQREIFIQNLGFQIQICQPKEEKKMQILSQLTPDPFPINIPFTSSICTWCTT